MNFTRYPDIIPEAAKEAVDGFTKCLTTAGMALRHRGGLRSSKPTTAGKAKQSKGAARQEGERSERDFASAMGASATQKRSLRNATPDCAATAMEEYALCRR